MMMSCLTTEKKMMLDVEETQREMDEEMLDNVDQEIEDEMEEEEEEDDVDGEEVLEEEEEEECCVEGEILIDFDYEFDACKYFDLSREETLSEALEAQSWFDFADTYPPSPFAAKLSLEKDAVVENASTSTHQEVDMRSDTSEQEQQCGGTEQQGAYRGDLVDSQTSNAGDNQGEPQLSTQGLIFYDHMSKDIPKAKIKYATKASLSKGSTLMKPTASQLAKQTRQEVHASNRFPGRYQITLVQHNQKSVDNPAVESQAAKRQKLEGGHLHKVAAVTKQQTNFIHKAPNKSGPVDGNAGQTKLKLTIPREPDLVTARRARRIRSKNGAESEVCLNSTAPTFRARPLNRKILKAPSLLPPKRSTPRLPEFQEFHLKTSERAMQHSYVTSSTTQPSNKLDKVSHQSKASVMTQNVTDSSRMDSVNAPKHEKCEQMHKFKARPLNKKIFSSKGDIGVFRNSKRETTVPMEFNLSTDKRSQYHPPVDLFTKMSLTSELQKSTVPQTKSAHPNCLPTKDSKENTINSFRQDKRIAQVVKEKAQKFTGNQPHCGIDGVTNRIGSRASKSRFVAQRLLPKYEPPHQPYKFTKALMK